MNTELLQKIKQKIIENPSHLDMNTWSCGTTACIAGWAGKLSNIKFPDVLEPLSSSKFIAQYSCEPMEMGIRLLDLTYAQAYRLFFVNNWPIELREAYDNAKSSNCKIKATCKRIDKFIESDGKI
jgi:aspartyl/asparaginyl-tRNA synthetase